MKRFLYVMRTAPYEGVLLQERLDVVLTTAAFDQPVALLFLDDGVFQIKKQQHIGQTGLKATLAMFDVLALYDITEVYVETESLGERGLQVDALSLPVKPVKREAVADLLRQFDVVC